MSITILNLALAWGAKKDEDGSITMSEFDRLGLPFFAGCQHCFASLAAYNAYPTRNCFISCAECVQDTGFKTAEDFTAWEKSQEEDTCTVQSAQD